MKINVGDIFQFPSGKVQYRVDHKSPSEAILTKRLSGVEIGIVFIKRNNPFFRKENKRYDYVSGEWFL